MVHVLCEPLSGPISILHADNYNRVQLKDTPNKNQLANYVNASFVDVCYVLHCSVSRCWWLCMCVAVTVP